MVGLFGIVHMNFAFEFPMFQYSWVAHGGMYIAVSGSRLKYLSSTFTFILPSRMKISCSQGCLWDGMCPPISISKSLIA